MACYFPYISYNLDLQMRHVLFLLLSTRIQWCTVFSGAPAAGRVAKRSPILIGKKRKPIYRMQIWRTTRSAPRTSCMNARLVSLLMSCFDNASPEKSCFVVDLVCFISLCLRVALFLNATRRDRNLPPFASKGK